MPSSRSRLLSRSKAMRRPLALGVARDLLASVLSGIGGDVVEQHQDQVGQPLDLLVVVRHAWRIGRELRLVVADLHLGSDPARRSGSPPGTSRPPSDEGSRASGRQRWPSSRASWRSSWPCPGRSPSSPPRSRCWRSSLSASSDPRRRPAAAARHAGRRRGQADPAGADRLAGVGGWLAPVPALVTTTVMLAVTAMPARGGRSGHRRAAACPAAGWDLRRRAGALAAGHRPRARGASAPPHGQGRLPGGPGGGADLPVVRLDLRAPPAVPLAPRPAAALGISPLADQQLSGYVAKLLTFGVLLAVAYVIFARGDEATRRARRPCTGLTSSAPSSALSAANGAVEPPQRGPEGLSRQFHLIVTGLVHCSRQAKAVSGRLVA